MAIDEAADLEGKIEREAWELRKGCRRRIGGWREGTRAEWGRKSARSDYR